MPLKDIQSSIILFSPLNWGLGHVTRSIPILHQLLEQGNKIYIGCDEEQERFYKLYFPQLSYLSHPGYPFKFGKKGNWSLDLLRNWKSLTRFLKSEGKLVDKWVEKYKIEVVISDQRYGFRSTEVKSVFITHQVSLPVGILQWPAQWWNRNLINKFDEIWVPDSLDQKWSGKLSKGLDTKKRFIGIQSRFQGVAKTSSLKYSYLAIISGPYPHNKLFLEDVLKFFAQKQEKVAIISPKSILKNHVNQQDHIDVFSDLNHDEFLALIQQSEMIISRAGYSTLMDLAVLQKKAILIPTPKQREQEYLAKLHKNEPLFSFKTSLLD